MSDTPTSRGRCDANRSDRRDIVYSFDVFDTCITRSHAHPRDLFYDLGMRLAPTVGSPTQAMRFARSFQTQRIRAEKRAYRKARPHECATIHEIYEQFRAPHGLDMSIEALIAAEVKLEQESIYPISHMRAHIECLRNAGHRVIFISDMYLPGDLLTPILLRLGIMREGETLYVSCDTRLTKASGSLFQHVLAQEHLAPDQLVHVGDNPHADVAMAQRQGLKAWRYYHGPLTNHEATIAGRRLPRIPEHSFLTAISRRSRLATHPQPETSPHPLDALIHSTIAPFLVSYVDWMLQDARARGIERLYFVARDGEILLRIAQALQVSKSSPELRYLYGSRRAWLGPSIESTNDIWKQLLVTPGQINTRSDILARAGLDIETQAHLAQALSCASNEWQTPLDSRAAFAFLEQICSTPAAAHLLYDAARRQRIAARTYLAEQGLFENTQWALVDTGWSLNCQAALKRIIEAESDHTVPLGYYMALARNHLNADQAGAFSAYITPPGSIFSRRRVVIEHAFTPSTHATTRGYIMQDEQAVPELGRELRDEHELIYAQRLHEAAETLARLASADTAVLDNIRRSRSTIQKHAARFLTHPRRADAQAMHKFGTIADLRHEDAFVQPLCRVLSWKDVLSVAGMAASARRSFMPASFMWLEGSCALSPINIRIPIRAMLAMDALRAHQVTIHDV